MAVHTYSVKSAACTLFSVSNAVGIPPTIVVLTKLGLTATKLPPTLLCQAIVAAGRPVDGQYSRTLLPEPVVISGLPAPPVIMVGCVGRAIFLSITGGSEEITRLEWKLTMSTRLAQSLPNTCTSMIILVVPHDVVLEEHRNIPSDVGCTLVTGPVITILPGLVI